MAGNENSVLQWDNFANNVSNAFQGMRKRSELFDVTLTCSDAGGRTLQAHKVLLSASSQFFQKIFCQQIAPSSHIKPFIYLKGVAFNDLSHMLDFVYNREVSVPKYTLQGFLNLAEELQISGLIRKQTNTKYTPFSHAKPKARNSESTSSYESNAPERPKQVASQKLNKKGIMHVKTPGTVEHHGPASKRKKGNEPNVTSDEGWASSDPEFNSPNTKKIKSPKKAKTSEEPFEKKKDDTLTNSSMQKQTEALPILTKNPHSPASFDSKRLDEKVNMKPKIEPQATMKPNVPPQASIEAKVESGVNIKPKVDPELEPKYTSTSSDTTNEMKPNPYVITEPHQSTKIVESNDSETKTNESEGIPSIAWPPKNGSMIATLYEDTFYLGKVSSKMAKDGSVRVDYMERYKQPRNKKGVIGTGDEYWVWPSKFDIYPTFQESVLGSYPLIEKVTNTQYMAGMDEVYFLTNYQTISRLANSSKSIIEGTIG